MPSDSILTFLDLAKQQRLLEPDDLESLFHQPDVPQSGLASIINFLQLRGVLTKFQADKIREGRGAELNFAGYPIIDAIGPCPGGVSYKAVRPGTTTPVVLRCLSAEWFAPVDNAAAYIQRAQTAGMIEHNHLLRLVDACVHADETYVVTEVFEGADLGQLVSDIGPMPALLAAEFGRQAARGLEAAHVQNLCHGDMRPVNLIAGPLLPMNKPRADGQPRYRPAPSATVKVSELGLVPLREPAKDWPSSDERKEQALYLPPERFADVAFAQAGDVYMLAGTIFYLLTGRAPYALSEMAVLLERKTSGKPLALEQIRPDAPASLVVLITEMLNSDPGARPSMSAVADRLEAIVRNSQSAAKVIPTTAANPPAPPVLVNSATGTSEGQAEDVILALSPPEEDNGNVQLVSAEGHPSAESIASLSGVDLFDGDFSALQQGQPPFWPAAVASPAYMPPPALMPQQWGSVPHPLAAVPYPQDYQAYEAEGDVAEQAEEAPTRRVKSTFSRTKLYLWLGVGALLWLSAFVIWYFLIFGTGGGDNDSEPAPKPVPKPPAVKQKK